MLSLATKYLIFSGRMNDAIVNNFVLYLSIYFLTSFCFYTYIDISMYYTKYGFNIHFNYY